MRADAASVLWLVDHSHDNFGTMIDVINTQQALLADQTARMFNARLAGVEFAVSGFGRRLEKLSFSSDLKRFFVNPTVSRDILLWQA